MPTLYVSAESPTAATILCAAAAVETSSATMSRSRGSWPRKRSLGWLSPPSGMRLGRAAIPISLSLLTEFRHRGMIHGDSFITVLLVVRANQIQPHALQAALPELQRFGRTIRQVDDPTRHDRPAVVHLHNNRSSIAQVRDPHVGPQRNRQARCRHVVHVIRLATSCRFAVKILAVPRRRPNLIRSRLVGLLADFGFLWG